jgi:hypothetical protein
MSERVPYLDVPIPYRVRLRKNQKSDMWFLPLSFTYGSLSSFLSKERAEFHYDYFVMTYAGAVEGLQSQYVNDYLNPESFEVHTDSEYVSNCYYIRERHIEASAERREERVKNEEKENFFKVSKVSALKDLQEGDVLNKSDLAIQVEDKLIQFEFVKERDAKKQKTIIKPGTWSLISTNRGLKLESIAIAKKRLLLDVTNTSTIVNEANCFFSNLDIYRELERPLKRGVLLYSQPGLGKSATIGYFCDKARTDDPGTVVIIWPTAKIEAYQFEEFLSSESEYDSSVTRVILVLEDIGGGEVECGRRAVDSSLLNLLDGVTVTFSLPTFIIATTNHPDNLLKSLADRPGRFDLMQELLPPNAEERVKLMEFISKRELTKEEKDAISSKEADTLSIAHLDEIVIRSRLHNKTIIQTLKEILKHRAFMNKNFDRNERTMGLGIDDDDDF